MLKKAAHKFAFLLALTFLVAPITAIHAQSVVSGGDPEPTGEPPVKPAFSPTLSILIVLTTFGLA